jgi:glutaminyl-tRNA synthetase
MPTLAGIRRRGYTPEAVRQFCERIGVGRSDSWIDMSILEDCVREDLNERAPRALAVLRPLKVVITNYPEDGLDQFEAANHPQKPEMGSRKVFFTREIFIEQDDFEENPPKGFFRMTPGTEVRLRYAYIVRCVGVTRDENGRIIEVQCEYDPASRGGSAADGRKIKGTIHWVSAQRSIDAEVRLFDRLFSDQNPDRGGADYKQFLNPESIEVIPAAKLEEGLSSADSEIGFQFERQGYFRLDSKDSVTGRPVFNRIVTLKDVWSKK